MTKRRFRTPGVFVEEVSFSPPPIVSTKTSIVAFVGYTERSIRGTENLHLVPTKISSLVEFELIYGKAFPSKFKLVDLLPGDTESILISGQAKSISFSPHQQSFLHSAVCAFFENGGSSCYIVSVGDYAGQANITIDKAELLAGLTALENEVEPSILAIPDAVLLEAESFDIYQEMLSHCAKARSRFAILDVPFGHNARSVTPDCITEFRNKIGTQNLSFGAAYYPWLHSSVVQQNHTSLCHCFEGVNLVDILPETNAQTFLNSSPEPNGDYRHQGLLSFSPTYSKIIEGAVRKLNLLPPSGFIAGIYSATDNSRGVWKAPANVRLNAVIQLSVNITNADQEDLNTNHVSGKSINAIREFSGKGILVWGARTLAGNDNEWRYINVKRTSIMVEQSIKNGLKPFTFEENNSVVWSRVKSTCLNFLANIWREGALAGTSQNEAFFVKAGLGETMTAQDVLEKRMIVEIGMALIRPAEFIILKVEQKMA